MILDPLMFLVSVVLYIAGAYSLYLIFSGIRNKNDLHKETMNKDPHRFYQPFYSIFLPVKNEAKVVGRLWDKLVEQGYLKICMK